MNKLEEISVNIACSLIVRGNKALVDVPRLATSIAKEIIDECEGESDKYNRIKKQK